MQATYESEMVYGQNLDSVKVTETHAQQLAAMAILSSAYVHTGDPLLLLKMMEVQLDSPLHIQRIGAQMTKYIL